MLLDVEEWGMVFTSLSYLHVSWFVGRYWEWQKFGGEAPIRKRRSRKEVCFRLPVCKLFRGGRYTSEDE